MLYEMGIPVVETGDRWHVNVHQKVPLNADRDNVTPSYLQKIRTITLNHMADLLKPESATATWVAAALEDKNAKPEAVAAIVKARFGDKVVISDPSDPEGTKMAVAQGYTVLAPRTFNHEQWVNVKAAGIKPAGQVTPSPKPYGDGDPMTYLPFDSMRPEMQMVVGHCGALMGFLTDRTRVEVRVCNEPTQYFAATYGPGSWLTLNVGKLGYQWFNYRMLEERHLALLLHEAAHEHVSEHLSSRFADEIAELGAKLAVGIVRRDVRLENRVQVVG